MGRQKILVSFHFSLSVLLHLLHQQILCSTFKRCLNSATLCHLHCNYFGLSQPPLLSISVVSQLRLCSFTLEKKVPHPTLGLFIVDCRQSDLLNITHILLLFFPLKIPQWFHSSLSVKVRALTTTWKTLYGPFSIHSHSLYHFGINCITSPSFPCSIVPLNTDHHSIYSIYYLFYLFIKIMFLNLNVSSEDRDFFLLFNLFG